MPLDLAFLKGRYDFELDRKEKLTGSLTLPVGILTALGGLIAVMARSFTYEDRALTQWLAGVPYVLDQVRDRMSNENQTHTTQQHPERQPVRPSTSAPAPTNPPAFPVNRIIREGGTSTEKK